MTIFLVLNGLGVVFLLYVLANFWKEEHRPKNNARKYLRKFERCDLADGIVVTHPISHSAQGGLSVTRFGHETNIVTSQRIARPRLGHLK